MTDTSPQQRHGLAASIRASSESETFDLNNHNVSTITSTMQGAFQEPFELQEMIRFTFVVGAGKQARQKYDPGATKAVTSVLVKCGYYEDRGASCVMECAGAYKLQHDTAKNLKTVVVFPKVSNSRGDAEEEEEESEPLLPKNSPGYKIAVSSMNVFQNMVDRQCPSWSQKKGCLESIEALKELMRDLDSQLVTGTPLEDSEQEFYDAVTMLDEKESYVKQAAAAQVESGQVTELEKQVLLQQNAERIALLKKENKPTAKAMQRKEMVESIETVKPHKLRHSAEIGKLQKELIPLLQVLEDAKGRLLTIKETQLLTRKEEIEEEIAHLEEASRGWFEDDEAFESRVQASREEFAKRAKNKKKTKSTAISGKTKVKVPVLDSNKWVTPGGVAGEGRKGYYAGANKKKAKLSKGNVFGAMMIDSDDDEEEVSENHSEIPMHGGIATSSDDILSAKKTEVEQSAKKKTKKKKKKKAKSKQEVPSKEEEVVHQEEEKEDKSETAIAQSVNFLQAFIFPIIVSFLGWFVGLVFGRPKKKGRGGR